MPVSGRSASNLRSMVSKTSKLCTAAELALMFATILARYLFAHIADTKAGFVPASQEGVRSPHQIHIELASDMRTDRPR